MVEGVEEETASWSDGTYVTGCLRNRRKVNMAGPPTTSIVTDAMNFPETPPAPPT